MLLKNPLKALNSLRYCLRHINPCAIILGMFTSKVRSSGPQKTKKAEYFFIFFLPLLLWLCMGQCWFLVQYCNSSYFFNMYFSFKLISDNIKNNSFIIKCFLHLEIHWKDIENQKTVTVETINFRWAWKISN